MRKLATTLSLSIVLFSCNSGHDDSVHNGFDLVTPEFPYSEDDNLLSYKGDLVKLEEMNALDSTFFIQINEKRVDELSLRAKKVPNQIYLINKGVEADELEQAIENKDEALYYFEFEDIDSDDLISKHFGGEEDAKIAYLSFDIYKDFYLVNDALDTIRANYSIYERDFQIAPYERIILSFTGVDEDTEYSLMYEDKLFGSGNTKFHFIPSNSINNIKDPS